MDFTPTTITQDNLETAVRKNMEDARAALATKVHRSVSPPLNADFDANGNVVGQVRTVDDHDACNRKTFLDLIP